MLVNLLIDDEGRIHAQSGSADQVLGFTHGSPCHSVVAMVDEVDTPVCTQDCSKGDARGGKVSRGFTRGRPARMQCGQIGHTRMCTIELLPLAPEEIESLTGRQREVLLLAADGFTDHEMARICEVSTDTIRSHLRGARRRLKARSRTEAVARALVMGLLDPRPGR